MVQESGRLFLKIEKFSEFVKQSGGRSGEPEVIQRLAWNILAIPQYEGYLTLFVQLTAKNSDSDRWSCVADLTLRVVAQKEGKSDLFVPKAQCLFNHNNNCFYSTAILIEDLMDPEKGRYIAATDTVIVEADLWAEAPIGLNIRTSLANRMRNLLSTGMEADVQFLVGTGEGEKEQFPAHKAVLSTEAYFYKKFEIDLKTGITNDVIKVTDFTAEVFRVVLNYIYTEESDGLAQNNVFDVLHAANFFQITGLIDACAHFVILDAKNVLFALDKASLYSVQVLKDRCWEFVDQNASAVLGTDKFMEIEKERLCELLARDQLVLRNDGEIAIWNAAICWADAMCKKSEKEVTGDNRREMLGPALSKIRFPLIPREKFASTVVPTKVLTKDEVFSVLWHYALPAIAIPSEYLPQFSSKPRAL